MEDNKKKNDAEIAVNVASMILLQLESAKCKPEIAYAALATAFRKMHISLGKNKADWLEIARQLSEFIKETPNKSV